MIDLTKEQLYSLPNFVKPLRQQRGVDRKYRVFRTWATEGWKPPGCDGPVAKLDTVNVAGVMHTTIEAFDRFVRDCDQIKAQVEREKEEALP